MALKGEKKKLYQREYMRGYMRAKRGRHAGFDIEVCGDCSSNELTATIEGFSITDNGLPRIYADGNPIWE